MDINQTVIDQPLFLIFKMKDSVMVFTTEEFLEAAIESWPEWDWNPQPLKSVQLNELSGHEFNSHPEPTLYSSTCSMLTFHFSHCLHHSPFLL